MPDARKTLPMLHKEWSTCTACDLGIRRVAMNGEFVAGEGTRRSIMFIGEGPGETEESYGRPFVGPSGSVLRKILEKLGLQEFYITNIVACRSCSQVTDPQGNPRFRHSRGGPPIPMLRDEPPLPTHIASCLPRLYEEIYLVDPIVIVTLGAVASEVILRHPLAITRDRGQTEHCYFPGATHRAVLTEKKGVWARKIHGKFEMPTEPNKVMYEVLPTIHPAYVLRKLADQGKDSPFAQLCADVRMAIKIYERYMLEAFGELPSGASDTKEDDILSEFTMSGEG